jgi:hypothetical protein
LEEKASRVPSGDQAAGVSSAALFVRLRGSPPAAATT